MINAQLVADNVGQELGSFFETEAHQNNAMLRYINSSVRDICLKKNFSFNKYSYTVTVLAGTTTYSIPFQIETFAILDSAGKEVTIKNFENYYKTVDKSNIIGIWDDVLISSMTGTFTILYRGFPTSITSLTQNIIIPEHFFDAIVADSIYYGYMDEKDYQSANNRKAIFNGLINDLATRNTNSYPSNDVIVGINHNF